MVNYGYRYGFIGIWQKVPNVSPQTIFSRWKQKSPKISKYNRSFYIVFSVKENALELNVRMISGALILNKSIHSLWYLESIVRMEVSGIHGPSVITRPLKTQQRKPL